MEIYSPVAEARWKDARRRAIRRSRRRGVGKERRRLDWARLSEDQSCLRCETSNGHAEVLERAAVGVAAKFEPQVLHAHNSSEALAQRKGWCPPS